MAHLQGKPTAFWPVTLLLNHCFSRIDTFFLVHTMAMYEYGMRKQSSASSVCSLLAFSRQSQSNADVANAHDGVVRDVKWITTEESDGENKASSGTFATCGDDNIVRVWRVRRST